MMLKVKAALVALVIVALLLRFALWALEPAIPLALVAIGLIVVYSAIFKRRW